MKKKKKYPIYTNVKRLAKEKRISIRSLEDSAHLGSGSICKWDFVSPSSDSLKYVADLLDTSVDSLLKDEGA